MPPTPTGLLDAFKRAGYDVIDEDEFNWLVARNETDVPFSLPKKGHRVAIGVTDTIMQNPFVDARLKKEILGAVSQDAAIVDPTED